MPETPRIAFAVLVTVLALLAPAHLYGYAHAANAALSTTLASGAERGGDTAAVLPTDLAAVATRTVLQVRCETYVDADADGLDDGVEACVLNKHAPLLYMPLGLDWTRPANVDWYLARSALRFHHNNCSDDQVVAIGGLTQVRLVNQFHRRKRGLASFSPCSHYGDYISTGRGPYDDNQHFFLQPNDATHAGSGNPADWITYGHVYPNDIGGMNVQYWFFYAYNDNIGSFNHEGDWESITVRLDPAGKPAGVYVCAHGHCVLDNYVTWHEQHHPKLWVADGSHASYRSEFACDRAAALEGAGDNCQTVSAYRWFTWRGGRGTQQGLQGGGVINVGEIGHALNGQYFIRYYAKWGENGTADVITQDHTSGPRTPTYQDSWDVGGL